MDLLCVLVGILTAANLSNIIVCVCENRPILPINVINSILGILILVLHYLVLPLLH